MSHLEQSLIRQTQAEQSDNERGPETGPSREASEIAAEKLERLRSLLDPRTTAQQYDMAAQEAMEVSATKIKARTTVVNEDIAQKTEALKEKAREARERFSDKAKKSLALAQRLETAIVRFKNFFRIKDQLAEEMRGEIEAMASEAEELEAQAIAIHDELERLVQEQATLPDPEQMLEAYYSKMETMPLSNEEKRELLRPEILAELNTEEYIALWRRLNPHFLSHVTRHGFRDHNATIYHSAGLEEYHAGLTEVLQDQKLLRPAIAVRDGLLARDEESIRTFLEADVLQADTAAKAKDALSQKLHFSLGAAPNYPDKTAVHFAAQLVADGFYGGEASNEIFFLYPSDTLASQHDFALNGGEKDLTQPQSELAWNDVFVWPSTLDNPGISVDAGMVFLPEKTPVDPQTGSKYASEFKVVDGEERRVMVEDKELVSAFIDWARSLTETSAPSLAIKEYTRVENSSTERDALRNCIDVLRHEMMRLGFCEEVANKLGKDIFSEWLRKGGLNQQEDAASEEALRELLNKSGSNWKRAENTIPAKAYWEAYFKQHPDQKPTHLAFYDGTPTAAIREFQIKHNIGQADVSEQEGALLGFDDRHIDDMREDPRAHRGYDGLVATAHRIIEEHYRS